jgi:excisionase family DNA binding protein
MDDLPTSADIVDTATRDRMAKARSMRPKGPRPKAEHGTIGPVALRVREAAIALNLGVTTTKQLVASGQLKSRKIGSVRLITIDEIKRFLRAR